MILIFLLLILFSIGFLELEQKCNSSKVFFILVGLISFVEGIRWYSGVDFYMYYNSYQKVLDPIQEMHNKRYDHGYLYLTMLFKKLGLPYTFFLVFISSISLVLHALFIKKYTSLPILALLVNFVCLIGFLGSNRQLIALALVVYGTHFLIIQKHKIFILFVLIASLFHFTAITLLILLFFNKEIKIKYWLVVSLSVLFFSMIPLERYLMLFFESNKNYFPFLYDRFNAYHESNILDINLSRICLGVLRRVVPIYFLLYYKDRFINFQGYFFFLNISILALFIYFWASLNFIYFLGRFTIYFSIYECIIYSWVLYLFIDKKKTIKYLSILVFYFFCVFLFFKGIILYPDLFIPYKTIFNF